MSFAYPNSPAPLALGAICFRDRPFPQILAAAAASGFSGIGLTVGQCVSALERGIALEELPERIADAGLALAELELVRLCDEGPTRYANGLVEDLIGVLEPDRVHTAAFAGDPGRIADEFAALCRRHPDTPVAVEFMPYSAVRDLASARQLVAHAGTPNAAIVLDIVHFFRSGSAVEEIDPDALRDVAVVQLSDVSARPGVPLAREARHLRTYPGRGSLDTAGFLRRIRESAEHLPPISVEPISDALECLPLDVVSEEVMFTTLRVLEQSKLR
ncbi:sugar phosphate isomerase/epimerase family protein [Amycolatopsis granulosa]|uniref:sugar phosphate isomerase/epimerase family protein n=1 Tax=Amycolatopsis granulosa TaxID=185684 RepID=UPI00142183F1|nr:sugar phosphate isomerase/epimerase [Amycolatopsis granulosa]NIH88363.1 sugar phosphate isomerase/epimerase [Amycolatopsis granulosa]